MWHTYKINEVIRNFRTNLGNGLTEEEVKKRQEKRKYNSKIYKTI